MCSTKAYILGEHLPLLRDSSIRFFSVCYTTFYYPECLILCTQILIWIFSSLQLTATCFLICSYLPKEVMQWLHTAGSGSLRYELPSPLAPLPWEDQQNTWSQLTPLHSSVLLNEKIDIHYSKTMKISYMIGNKWVSINFSYAGYLSKRSKN